MITTEPKRGGPAKTPAGVLGQTNDQGVLVIGTCKTCLHCGEPWVAQTNDENTVVWWRPRTDCCVPVLERKIEQMRHWANEYKRIEHERLTNWRIGIQNLLKNAKTDLERQRIQAKTYKPDEELREERQRCEGELRRYAALHAAMTDQRLLR